MGDAISPEEKIEATKAAFYATALEACGHDYDRLKDVSKTLETKAQVTISVAGIFIAAIFAFVRDIHALELTQCGLYLLGLVIGLLITTVFFSMLVLLSRTNLLPLTGNQLNQTVDEMLVAIKSNTESDYKAIRDLKISFIGQQVTGWNSAVESIDRLNKRKAVFLKRAHVILLVAMFFVCVLTLGILSGELKGAVP